MSERSERRSLLGNSDIPIDPSEYGPPSDERVVDEDPTSGKPTSIIDSKIVAIFAVAFDIRSGNVLEWSMPSDFDYGDVEFKAMASGMHTIMTDFNYFKINQFFGLSCYHRLKLEGEEAERERGARMKSVGVLSISYNGLHTHLEFLQQAVEHLNRNPGNYAGLEEYYQRYKTDVPLAEEPALSSMNTKLPRLTITHPAGSFGQVWQFFGENIFLLWKAALLRHRILFVSPPPTGVTCYRVYCACLMATYSVGVVAERDTNPLFFVNVADVPQLEKETSYIACTTEKIFGMKTNLYDVYVDNQNITMHGQMGDALHCTAKDCLRYQQVESQWYDHALSVSEEDVSAKDKMLIENFQRMNDRILSKLTDISRSTSHQLSKDEVKQLGLDPVGDYEFLQQLIDLYSFDVELEPMGFSACCPELCY